MRDGLCLLAALLGGSDAPAHFAARCGICDDPRAPDQGGRENFTIFERYPLVLQYLRRIIEVFPARGCARWLREMRANIPGSGAPRLNVPLYLAGAWHSDSADQAVPAEDLAAARYQADRLILLDPAAMLPVGLVELDFLRKPSIFLHLRKFCGNMQLSRDSPFSANFAGDLGRPLDILAVESGWSGAVPGLLYRHSYQTFAASSRTFFARNVLAREWPLHSLPHPAYYLHMMISVAEAAADLGISPRRVRQLIEAGRLAAKIVGGTYIIDSRALDAVRVRVVGKPKKLSAIRI